MMACDQKLVNDVNIKIEEAVIEGEEEKVDSVEKEIEDDKLSPQQTQTNAENNNETTTNNDITLLPHLGRNRRVRQKNRYFSDFHCIDLTKGQRATKEGVTYDYKFCSKCEEKTYHMADGGCQTCLYEKIVKKHKKQKPASKRGRSANNSKQQQAKQAKQNNNNNNNTNNNVSSASSSSSSSTSTITTTTTITTTNTNSNINTITNSDKILRLDTWAPDDVGEYIKSNGFLVEAELFKAQSVDGISLLLMQRADFIYGLKIKLGPALKIYDNICKLKREYFNSLVNGN